MKPTKIAKLRKRYYDWLCTYYFGYKSQYMGPIALTFIYTNWEHIIDINSDKEISIKKFKRKYKLRLKLVWP